MFRILRTQFPVLLQMPSGLSLEGSSLPPTPAQLSVLRFHTRAVATLQIIAAQEPSALPVLRNDETKDICES